MWDRGAVILGKRIPELIVEQTVDMSALQIALQHAHFGSEPFGKDGRKYFDGEDSKDLIKYPPLTAVPQVHEQTVYQPGDQACRVSEDSARRQGCRGARGDASTGPSVSDCAEDGGSPAGAVRRQSSGCACVHADAPERRMSRHRTRTKRAHRSPKRQCRRWSKSSSRPFPTSRQKLLTWSSSLRQNALQSIDAFSLRSCAGVTTPSACPSSIASSSGTGREVRGSDAVRVGNPARAAGFVSTDLSATAAVAADPQRSAGEGSPWWENWAPARKFWRPCGPTTPSSALELPSQRCLRERDTWFFGLLRQAQSGVIVVRLLSNSWTVAY